MKTVWTIAGIATAAACAVLIAAAAKADQPARIYSAAQAERGIALYLQRCAVCHDRAMSGLDVNPALTGAGFLSAWNGRPVSDLTSRIRTTMPLDDPGSLGLADTAALTAAILRANGFPAGEADLPARTADQRAIIIQR